MPEPLGFKFPRALHVDLGPLGRISMHLVKVLDEDEALYYSPQLNLTISLSRNQIEKMRGIKPEVIRE